MGALRTAGTLANQLGARITIVVPEVVSYQLPLDKPPVCRIGTKDDFQVLARECPVRRGAVLSLPRSWQTLTKVLKPHSLVVLGGKKHWWPTAESRLARRLRNWPRSDS